MDVVDTTQQVTSTAQATKVKNPKRVAAGKAIPEKNRLAREEQKKKLAEAETVMAKERLRKAQEVVDPHAEKTVENPPEKSTTLTTTQWLSVASIIVSLAAIYYKREELKGVYAKFKTPAAVKPPPAPKKSVIRSMD